MKHACCWIDGVPPVRYPALRSTHTTDVAIVGGGIVGLTAAYLLAAAGREVTLIEALSIGRGVTGLSSAKITSQHTLKYADLIRRHGVAKARLYADANRAGAGKVWELAQSLHIACDIEERDAYAFTLRPDRRDALEAEASAARSLGFPADVVARAPLPFQNAGALRFGGQAQFNPVRYLTGLARHVASAGGRLYQQTRVTKVIKKSGDLPWTLVAGVHRLHARELVTATHLPLGSPVQFDVRTRPRCHIAMAFRAVPEGMLDGMFIGTDAPAYSLRMAHDRKGPLLIVLAPEFPTGWEKDVEGRFARLESWVRTNVPAGAAEWRWVNEDYDTLGGLPFAGELAHGAQRMFVATGFSGWGISNGTASAMLIADQLLGRPNPWSSLYDPSRRANSQFNRGGESQSVVGSVEQIARDSGGVVTRGRQRIAVWRSAEGALHALSARCTHMGCTVTWNNAQRTWDCPCHGSVFARDGSVLHGPATEPLRHLRVPKHTLGRPR